MTIGRRVKTSVASPIQKSRVVCALVWFFVASVCSAGAIPPFINYQGTLTDASGKVLTGDHALSFSLFKVPSGGTAVWGPQIFDGGVTQGHGARVPVVQGYFNVILGPVDTAGRKILASFTGSQHFIEISVDGGSPIAPRQQVLSTPTASNGVPPGIVSPFAGAQPPAGYLICDGTAVSRTTYDALFAAIGTTYGAGNGTSTFNLPDIRGRVVMGVGQASDVTEGATNWSLAARPGKERHTLTAGEMPVHSHSLEYIHRYVIPGSGIAPTFLVGSGTSPGYSPQWSESTNAGGSQPHEIMQPSIVLNYVIKY